ncbi:MAG: hypothetical protein NC238_02850 [Dehalobacter sp.]|nr:hypothetical protein [Dehalobacter sp.]
MIKEALQYILSLKAPEIFEHDGMTFADKSLNKIPEIIPHGLQTRSLASLVNLVSGEIGHKRLADRKIIIHVKSPTEISVSSSFGANLDRYELYSAVAEVPHIVLGKFVDFEAMNIQLKSCFLETPSRDDLIAYLGNIQEDAVKTSSDDGFSQTTAVKTGIASVSMVPLKPIVLLAPYRTFIEVDQPRSEFLVRLQTGSGVALFEADGGAWRIQARKNIKEYFSEEFEDLIEENRIIITE